MTRHNIGDRVYAVAGSRGETVRVFGPGTYAGYRDVLPGRGLFGRDLTPEEEEAFGPLQNHCIELDTGEVVYGHECWWGSEAAMKPYTEGRDVVQITIAEYYASADDSEAA